VSTEASRYVTEEMVRRAYAAWADDKSGDMLIGWRAALEAVAADIAAAERARLAAKIAAARERWVKDGQGISSAYSRGLKAAIFLINGGRGMAGDEHLCLSGAEALSRMPSMPPSCGS
jgi:hypothetical protein